MSTLVGARPVFTTSGNKPETLDNDDLRTEVPIEAFGDLEADKADPR